MVQGRPPIPNVFYICTDSQTARRVLTTGFGDVEDEHVFLLVPELPTPPQPGMLDCWIRISVSDEVARAILSHPRADDQSFAVPVHVFRDSYVTVLLRD